jgi:hypothetical protein
MNRNHMRALLIAAATLVATGANADDAQGQPTGAEKAAEKAADKAGKAMDKAEKAADKAEKAGDMAAKAVEDRAARRAKEHDAQREKLSAAWKGPVSDALRQELRRHAERLARLERIKAIAETQKDKESVEKATKLFAKENERHEKWLSSNVPVLGATPATTPTPAAENGKEGAR